ncbi:tail fiber domain-containing protein [Fulvivirga sp.]|uniref:tail fiber domain-containing protein n=1 Tax=Fulvivirga sp. TaxID=1931237 RepID=UPI0032EB9E65
MMKTQTIPIQYLCIVVLSFICTATIHAQKSVTIGSEDLNNKSVLTLVTSTGDQGFILPVVENKNSINPGASENGMLVYESTTSSVFLWNGTEWLNIAEGSSVSIDQLSEIGDVSAELPTDGQMLQFQSGVGWVASDVSFEDTDNQELSIAEDVLTIENGTESIDLSGYKQDLNLAGTELSITNGSIIDLAALIPSNSDDQTATEVIYDNTASGLIATDVQSALDELSATPPGSLWSTKGDNIHFSTGNIGVGTADPAGKLHVDITTGSTESRALHISNNYTGTSAAYGSYIDVNGESTGSKIGNYVSVESGQGAKAGQIIEVDQQAEATGYGQFIQLVSDNADQPAAGVYHVHAGLGSGDKYGILSGVGSESGKGTGFYTTIQGGEGIGLHTVISNNTGNSTGVLSEISENTSPISRGFHSIISEGGEKVGYDSDIVQDNDILHSYGLRSNIVNNNSEVEQYGIHSTILGSGVGDKFGIWSNLRLGSGKKTGIYSTVRQGGDQPSYGIYSNVIHNSSAAGYAFYSRVVGNSDLNGFYNSMITSSGTLTAMTHDLETDSDGKSLGNYVHIYGTGTGSRTSFSSRIVDGNNEKIGYNSQIVQNSPRTTYGFESTITDNSNGGSVGLRLRVVDNVSAGVAYGILSSGDSLNTFEGSIRAGYQISAPIIKAGSWNFQDEKGVSPPDLLLYGGGTIKGGFEAVSGVYYNASDERLKMNVHRMGAVLASVMQLKPSRYKFKDNGSNSQENIGLIAQEVMALFPDLVNVVDDGNYKDLHTLNYSGLSVVAIKAIQEQQEIIITQEERIRELEDQMKVLLKQTESKQ